jgi:peptidoglycan/LPS O-acetylase OafA/YrhL
MTAKRDVGPDLLRALAILLVMSHHLPVRNLPSAFWFGWGQFGWLGVDIFFVLSGYLIGSELLKPVQAGSHPSLLAFYIKRSFRILPAFGVILAVYALAPGLREAPSMAPLWRFLTFTMNFGLNFRTAQSFSQAWSLCVEEHFYLLLPMLILLFQKARRVWLPVVLMAGIVLGGMALRHSLWIDWRAQDGDTVAFMKSIYYPSYTRLDGLVMGVSLAAIRLWGGTQLNRFIRPAVVVPIAALFLATALFLVTQSGLVLDELGAIVLYPLFALGVTLFLAGILQLEPQLGVIRWSGLPFVATISYSLYLSQKLVFHADRMWLPDAWLHGWGGVSIFYASAIAVAAALYFVVERPFMRLRRTVLGKLTSATAR